MSIQVQKQKQHGAQKTLDKVDERPAEVDESALTGDIDAILDEIDEVLEANAEAFVSEYIQKGGE